MTDQAPSKTQLPTEKEFYEKLYSDSFVSTYLDQMHKARRRWVARELLCSIYCLFAYGKINKKKLAAHCHLSLVTISRYLNSLEDIELIVRKNDSLYLSLGEF